MLHVLQSISLVRALSVPLLVCTLVACGGGGGGGTTLPPTDSPPTALNYNYQYTSLTGSPTFALSTVTLSTATAGTLTLVAGSATDAIGYQLNTATGVLTPVSPYTIVGDLRQAALMVCKPVNSVEGAISATQEYAKAIHVVMPATATPGTIEDLKGRTFDIYDNCDSSRSVVFDPLGNSTLFQGTRTVGTITAAAITPLLRPEGVTEIAGDVTARTDTVTQYRVFKSDSKAIVVTRRFIKQPLKNIDNTSGEIGVWMSR